MPHRRGTPRRCGWVGGGLFVQYSIAGGRGVDPGSVGVETRAVPEDVDLLGMAPGGKDEDGQRIYSAAVLWTWRVRFR